MSLAAARTDLSCSTLIARILKVFPCQLMSGIYEHEEKNNFFVKLVRLFRNYEVASCDSLLVMIDYPSGVCAFFNCRLL